MLEQNENIIEEETSTVEKEISTTGTKQKKKTMDASAEIDNSIPSSTKSGGVVKRKQNVTGVFTKIKIPEHDPNNTLARINEIAQHPERYDQNGLIKLSTYNDIFYEALKRGLAILMEENATDNNLITQMSYNHLKTHLLLISELFAEQSNHIINLQLQVAQTNFLLKSSLLQKTSSDDVSKMLNYNVEDLMNVNNESVNNYLDKVREKLMDDNTKINEESLVKVIKEKNKII
ncbi:MAG: hypothetical protein ACRC4M_04915 [Mycoplasma sp.]